MTKPSSLCVLLILSATCSSVWARSRFSPPGSIAVLQQQRRRMQTNGDDNDGIPSPGSALVFDPPILTTSYVGGDCTGGGGPDTIFPGQLASIKNTAYGEFCIGDLVDGQIEYSLLDEITCTPWGIFERYSACTDETCNNCTPEAISYFQLEEILNEPNGYCYDLTYSRNPTSFDSDELFRVGYMFDDNADMSAASDYWSLIGLNSCISTMVVEEAIDDDAALADDITCQSIPDLICNTAGYTVLCDLFTKWAPEVYEAASTDYYTLFAPSDVAFEKISGPLTDGSLSDEEIGAIFFYHATEGFVMMKDLVCGEKIEMAMAGNSRTKCTDGGATMFQMGGGNRSNNLFPVIDDADIMACNGIIHLVSEVMLPNFVPEGFV